MDSQQALKSKYNQAGQVVVEYVLLLIITVSIAIAIAGALIGRNGSSGVVITTWNGIISTIAKDIPN